jgi:hypothetical protein
MLLVNIDFILLIKFHLEKPGMGDTRVNFLRGYDWKAHHRETNNLFVNFKNFMNYIISVINQPTTATPKNIAMKINDHFTLIISSLCCHFSLSSL